MRLYDKTFSLYNMHIIPEGYFMYSVFQINLDYYNVNMDMHKAVGGTSIVQNCSHPEGNPNLLVKLENVNFYFSRGKFPY